MARKKQWWNEWLEGGNAAQRVENKPVGLKITKSGKITLTWGKESFDVPYWGRSKGRGKMPFYKIEGKDQPFYCKGYLANGFHGKVALIPIDDSERYYRFRCNDAQFRYGTIHIAKSSKVIKAEAKTKPAEAKAKPAEAKPDTKELLTQALDELDSGTLANLLSEALARKAEKTPKTKAKTKAAKK